MKNLVLVTFIWAFSFSFIGEFLAGKIDSYFSVLVRVSLASIVFLPFTKFKNIPLKLSFSIMFIGAMQIGLMYLFYYNSFLYLSVAEVALFTIFTPFYVTLVYDAFSLKFKKLYLVSIGIAFLGAFVIKYDGINNNSLKGFLLVQGANLCFGAGQSLYKILIEKFNGFNQRDVFGYFHFGAFIVVLIAFALFGNFEKLNPNLTQTLTLIWLGVVASGVGYFLWNKGACDVDSGVLAIMNNALIPAAILVNLLFWQKDTDLFKLIIGSSILYISLIIHNKIIKYYNTNVN
ncbi:DMT family transporter [Campylobacter pinnipediorum]|uniref:DMT family transporter n=1 Tax=Campylobacter pinnipediorum TaxID=1965231 RepID=UPI00084CF302|nr:DMT family transporter [Campylobacter pinnipediorum]